MKNLIIIPVIIFLFIGCKKENPVEQHDEQIIKIDFEYNRRDELNTFEGYVQKDLVIDGTAKAMIWLTEEEQKSIIDVLDGIQFFSFPDTIQREPNVYISPDFSPDKLRIKYNGQEITVVWYYPMQIDSPYSSLLTKLTSKILDVLYANWIYKQLPPRNGGYD